jgi:hypothetical protein
MTKLPGSALGVSAAWARSECQICHRIVMDES